MTLPMFFLSVIGLSHRNTLSPQAKKSSAFELYCKIVIQMCYFVYGNVLLWPVSVSTSLSHLCSTLLTIILTCVVMCQYILELFFNCCPNWHSLDVGF
jgi:hypothetical protein